MALRTRLLPLTAVALIALCASLAFAAPVSRTELPNGLIVVAAQDDSSAVAGVAVVVKASALDEQTYGIGTRAVLEQIILTQGQDALEGLRELASANANRRSRYLVHTDYDLVEARISVEVDELVAGLAKLRAFVFAPDLSEEALEQAREFVQQGYDASHRSPVQTTYELFRAAFYGSGPLAGPMEGDHEAIAAVTLDQVRTLHREEYAASNTVIGIVSPLAAEGAAAAVRDAFGDLPQAPAPQPPALPAPPAQSEVEVGESMDLGQASMVVGVPAAGPADGDWLVGLVINQLLDGPGGRIRRDRALLQALGLVIPSQLLEAHYPIKPLAVPLTRQPYLAIHALCSPTTIERTRRGLLRHLLALRSGSVADAELQLAGRRVINSRVLERRWHGDAALQIAQCEALGMPCYDDAEFAAAVAAITREDLTAFALRHFDRHAIGIQMPAL